MEDPIEGLVREVSRRLSPDLPFFATAAEVIGDAAETLDLDTMVALQVIGFEAVKNEGAPPEEFQLQVPDVIALIAAGEEFAPDKVSMVSLTRLAILGFGAIAAERLADAEFSN